MYKRRCYVLFILFIMCFLFIYGNIIKLQFKDADRLSVLADSQYQYTEKTQELNYKLLDCNGKNMINYNREYRAVIIYNTFAKNDIKKHSDKSLQVLQILKEYNDEYDIMNKKHWGNSEKLIFIVDYETFSKLKNIKDVKGFYTYCYYKVDRSKAWSIENMITNIRNLNNAKKKSENSLEIKIHNNLKNNKDYKIDFKVDMDGNIAESINNDYLHNKNVRLTLNRDMQYRIRSMLNQEYEKYEQIGVIVMESNTGKIKAMVQKNDKLPNVNIGAETLNGFFPGSIFKTIILEGELEKNGGNENKKFLCTGLYEGSRGNNCHGKLNIEDAFITSCNHIYSQIGKHIGFKYIYELSQKQGLFNKVLGFHKEQAGKLQVKEPKWEDGTLAFTAMGQNIRITPIEAISIVNTVINQGVYVKPYIVDAYVYDDKEEVLSTEKSCILSTESSYKVKKAMRKVVEYGTGRRAKINKVDIGGKTGSTERIETIRDKNNKKVYKKFSDGWFIGFFQEGNKTYSLVVFVKDIDAKYEGGGTTAAPVFKDTVKILRNMMNK